MTSSRVEWQAIRWPTGPRVSGALFGIEIETEATNPYDTTLFFSKYRGLTKWTATADGSLRNFGIEYVSTPLDQTNAKKEVTDLLTCLREFAPGVMPWCPRAGVHVHMNVRDMTSSEIWTAACIYWTIEHYLTEWCGESRVCNNFCLRLKDATRLVGSAISGIQSITRTSTPRVSEWRSFGPNTHKYAGLNLATVNSLGTLEFRALDGTTDPVRINHWIDQVAKIRELAIEFGNPHRFFEWLDTQTSSMTIASKLLTTFMYSQIQDHNAWLKQIYLDIPLPLSVAYACNNWDVYSAKVARLSAGNSASQVTAMYNELENIARDYGTSRGTRLTTSANISGSATLQIPDAPTPNTPAYQLDDEF